MTDDPIEIIVNITYPDFEMHCNDVYYLNSRAILAPTIDERDMINNYMLGLTPGEVKTHLSSDSASSSNLDIALLQKFHSPEFLNTIKCSVVPSYELKLKVGALVMLMRNIDHSSRLCNGTRLIVTKLGSHILEAQMMSGTNAWKKILIPKLSLTPSSDLKLTFTFQRTPTVPFDA
ncbi:unnamed protein product [Cuscuta epithymum]|uniref:DNA helicase Pif1-like 2B domain-containing protein n=1 Tax=Cuscuta epithymum TaxID=186058 RepID=A0AAV0FGA1_9ASTE|nr:unnamed protein product [Cuscuta epithymum]